MKSTFILFILLSLSQAQNIQIKGLHKTNPNVVLQEFKSTSGSNPNEFQEGIRRLRNMNIFSQVDGKWNAQSPTLHMNEKWTTIPIAKAKSGGGITSYTLGVYDPNIFGEYLELGTQYENINGEHSGVIWFRNPRLLGTRTLLGLEAWRTQQINFFYETPSSQQQQYANQTWLGEAFLEHEFTPSWTGIFRIKFRDITLSSSLLENADENGLAIDTADIGKTGEHSQQLSAYSGFRYGQINTHEFEQEGWEFKSLFGLGTEKQNSYNKAIFENESSIRYYSRPINRVNLAFRAAYSQTTSSSFAQQNFLGGFEHIRSIPEGQIYGKRAWFSSFESRWAFFTSKYSILQAVAFTDLGDATNNQFHAPAQTVGGGMRFLFPTIYRLNIRLDWGTQINDPAQSISFGLQQFF